MHPLIMIGLLPDSRQVSREASERHAILTALKERDDGTRARSRLRLRLRLRLLPS